MWFASSGTCTLLVSRISRKSGTSSPWRKIMARSRALISCPGAVSPWGFAKCAVLAPSSRARAVMRAANTSSEPARPSATTSAASLAELSSTA